MKEKWLMVCNNLIIDTCLASSYNEADNIFKNRSRYIDWAESETISEADFNYELELELKSF